MKHYLVLLYYCGLILFALNGKVGSTESKTDVPTIHAVAGDVATIPCNLSTPVEEDEATMILWYRSDIPNPIYTLDLRNVPLQTARHFPAKEMEGRLKFNVNIHPPVLYITPVKTEDEAEYKCRVDLRRARTLILHSKLVIIVPPSDPIIMDEHGQRVNGVIGPYDEGARVVLTCDVDGGDPAPSVTWWRGTTLIDDSYFLTRRGFARNRFVLPRIQREDLLTELSCRAANNKIVKPKETNVKLDINLYPLSVTIVEPKYPLLAGELAEIVCETVGSRPMALMTWWLDELKVGPGMMVPQSKQVSNVTTSVFKFKPKPEENGKRLTCKSVNPSLPNVTLESDMILKVHFIPMLNISLGRNQNATDIMEGSDVELVCTVWANPKMSEVTWMFNERLIAVNQTEKIITSRFTLSLKNVSRMNAGKYRCLAANIVGQGSSKSFQLQVKFPPTCKHSNVQMHGVAETESINVTCKVDAEPLDVSFRWSFTNDKETAVLQNWTTIEGNNTITYTPKVENGYGMLSCWGRNSVGLQLDPCLIKIVPAGAPESPHSCSVVNQTIINLTVECEPGYNGSLFQVFHVEVYDSVLDHLQQNLTKIDRPIFVVNGLTPGTSYVMIIYASNKKGRSESVALMTSTLRPEEIRTESNIDHLISPAFIIIIGLVSSFSIILLTIILIMKCHAFRRRKTKDTIVKDIQVTAETTKKDLEDSTDNSGKGPDIIPFTIEAEVTKLGEILQYSSSPESSPRIPVRQKYTHTVL